MKAAAVTVEGVRNMAPEEKPGYWEETKKVPAASAMRTNSAIALATTPNPLRNFMRKFSFLCTRYPVLPQTKQRDC